MSEGVKSGLREQPMRPNWNGALLSMRLACLFLVPSIFFPVSAWGQAPTGVPVFEITPVESSIKFAICA